MDNLHKRKAFTLIEVLISITLLSLVLVGLYDALDMQKRSNKYLFEYLKKTLASDKSIMVLYKDLLSSNGDIEIKNGEFDRLCIKSTTNSLYALSDAKVCWIVSKENNQLLRVEGGEYKLPLKYSDRVAVDSVMKNIILFNVSRKKDDILIVMQSLNEKPYAFMLHSIIKSSKKIKKNTKSSPKI